MRSTDGLKGGRGGGSGFEPLSDDGRQVKSTGGKVDIVYLIDRLEQLINAGKRVPLSTRIMIDEQDVLDIIDQMRSAIPEEVKQAKRALADREWIIQQAQSEADKILELAREQAEIMLDEKGLLQTADARARELMTEAEHETLQMRAQSEVYARQVLEELDEFLSRQSRDFEGYYSKQLAVIRKGISRLHTQGE